MGWFRNLGDSISKFIPGVDLAWKIGTGIYDAVNQKKERSEDQQIAKDNREEDQQREDTSYQRTVADMRSAGLSPSTLSGGLDGGAIQSQIAPRSTPTLSSMDPFGNTLQYDMNKQSIDAQSKWNQDANDLKAIELGIMSQDAKTREQSEKNLADYQAKQIALQNEENERKERERVQREKQEIGNQLQNLILRGNTSGDSLNVGVNSVIFGASGQSNVGVPWTRYGYSQTDAYNLMNSTMSPDWVKDKVSVKWNGDIPVFCYQNNKGEWLWYDKSKGSWYYEKYSKIKLLNQRSDASKDFLYDPLTDNRPMF